MGQSPEPSRPRTGVIAAVGLLAAVFFRVSTVVPGASSVVGDGAVAAELLVTFAVLVPGLFGWLVESVLPTQAGPLALPRLQAGGRLLYGLGVSALVVSPFFLASGEVGGGHLAMAWQDDTVNSAVLMTIGGLAFCTLFTATTAVNAILTVHQGMARGRRPSMLGWSLYARSVVVMIAGPMLLLALLLVIGERTMGLSLFAAETGGDPALFTHLYWFGAHPLIYTAALPAMGVAIEVAGGLSGRISGRSSLTTVAVFAVGATSLFAWGQHVPGGSGTFKLLCALFAVAANALLVLLVGRVLSTLQGGRVLASSPLLFSLGATALAMVFSWLGVASAPHGMAPWFGLSLYGPLGLDLLVALTGFAAAGAGLFWMPRGVGRVADEALARAAFASASIGAGLVLAGDLGWSETATHSLAPAALLGTGAILLAGGFGLWLAARRRSQVSSANPWHARGVEWRDAEATARG